MDAKDCVVLLYVDLNFYSLQLQMLSTFLTVPYARRYFYSLACAHCVAEGTYFLYLVNGRRQGIDQ